MKPEQLFRTGSMGKQYTAIAILQLVEQGKIRLQDSIQQYIPDFPPKGHTITIENLLTNTSGIKNYFEISNPSKERSRYTPKEGVDYLKDEPLKFAPGTQYDYSNSNFYLLGYIIEVVTGTPYENYLRENVLDKAGLTNTFYIHPEIKLPDMATGYSRFKGKLENAELQEITTLYAAGGLISNADDIYKWHNALYEYKLVKKETLEKATTPFRFADGSLSLYAYGWFVKDIDGSSIIQHSGSTDGYQSDAIYFPKENVFVVALYNCFQETQDWEILTDDIARLSIGKPLNNGISLPNNILQSYTGTYQFTAEHSLIINFIDGKLFVEATNPKDRLPRVQLYAATETQFFIKEAPLKFEFARDTTNNTTKIITYNNRGKDAEWKKIK